MLAFRFLDTTPVEQLVDAFNEAFSDYVVPVHMEEEQFRNKCVRDRIDLAQSVGVFDGEKMVGFIFNGMGLWNGQPTAYNAGTGVIPEYRGQQLTQRMYDFLLPLLRQSGVQQCLLEVMSDNAVAYHIYQKMGFQKTRNLVSFKGDVESLESPLESGIQAKVITALPWSQLEEFWNHPPSWQHGTEGMRAIWDQLVAIGLHSGGQLIGYGVKHRNQGRLMQFGVLPEFRNQGLGRYLFAQLGRVGNPMLLAINIDYRDEATVNALRSFNMEHFLEQHEMVLEL